MQHSEVDRQGVVPALALQDLEVDGVVAEARVEAAVQHLDQVRLCDTRTQLVDEGGRVRAQLADMSSRPGRRLASR